MYQAILRLPAVQDRTGLSRSAVYGKVKEGVFPKPIKLDSRAVGWIESEISDWISQRIEQSRATQRQVDRHQASSGRS